MNPVREPLADSAFGRFRMSPRRRELLADGQPVKLGGRAFDVLTALIEARGAVLSKDALMGRVWPSRIVEENALESQVAAVRRALGDDRHLIRTVFGRGYQFTGELRELLPRATETAKTSNVLPSLPSTNVPEASFELIGREEELGEILNLAATHRLVTLAGAGGIGKTALALALARKLRPHFTDGVWLAEFSGLADPALVPASVASVVGLELGGEASAERVAQVLANRQLLLVLDTCEHVIDTAAAFAEALLKAGPSLHVIVTSREPLRAEGEWVYGLRPLAVPTEDAVGDQPLRYGAVRLFIERARAAGWHLAPDQHQMATVTALCRRLDGLPLAIELAAARATMLGVEELTARLDDHFGLLSGGRRTALPRHQTLRATFDWSYELLAESERVILRRLAVFAGAFSLHAASMVAASLEIAPSQVADGLSSLLAKSLVTADAGGVVRRYRLLDRTRAYALEKLTESGERDTLARCHAEHHRDLFERAEAEGENRAAAEWLDDYGWCIDNLRAALDWAFAPGGEASLGVALTAAAVPLWMQLSLLDECRGRAEHALAVLSGGASPDIRREMKLQAALAVSLRYTKGVVPETGAALTRTFDLAKRLDDADYQLRSLWELWSFHITSGQYFAAVGLAQNFCTLAASRSNPGDRLVGERLIGVSEHLLGDQESARRHLEHKPTDDAIPRHRHVFRFQIDPQVWARVFLARVLWLQGFPDQAMRTAESSLERARAANLGFSFCFALSLGACLLALLVGRLTEAERYVDVLLDHSTKHSLAHWHAWGHCHQGALAIKRGDLNAGLRRLCAGIHELGGFKPAVQITTFLMVEALSRTGQIADGLAAIEEVIVRAERTQERWLMAELLRIKGELLLLEGATGAAAAAEDYFRQALDVARGQGALSWELRAAASLARLLREEDNPAEGIAILQPIYDRFTEGFDTVDLKDARILLSDLRG